MDHKRTGNSNLTHEKHFQKMTVWRGIGNVFCIWYSWNGNGLVLHSPCKPWIAVRLLT